MKNPENKNTARRPNLYLIVLFLGGLIGFQPSIYAQASLASEDRIDDIVVTTNDNEEKTYTIFRDAVQKHQFFYVPKELNLKEIKDKGGKISPSLTLLRYQYIDDKTGLEKQGGILQGVMNMSMEPEVVENVKKQILERLNKNNTIKAIKLSAIPLYKCDFSIRTDKGLFLGNPEAKTDFQGPLIASQDMAFTLSLNELGAAVIGELAQGKGGIQIQVNIAYHGLTPPCGYDVSGNYSSAYSFYDNRVKIEGGFKIWKWGHKHSKTKQKIRESLTSNKFIKTKIIVCDTVNKLDDEHLERLLTKLETEMFNKDFQDREAKLNNLNALLINTKDENAKKKLEELISKGKLFLETAYQKSTKDIEKRRKGKFHFNQSKQYKSLRSTSFSSIIGFGKYGMTTEQLIENKNIIDIDANSAFPYVAIGLPEINPHFDLSALALDISYTNSEGKTHSVASQWTKADKWTNIHNNKIGYLRFNLIGEKDIEKRGKPEFDIRLQVISKIPNSSFIIEKKYKLSSGNRNFDAIELLTEAIIIDGSNLDFKKITKEKKDLDFATIKLEKGEISIKKNIKSYITNGVYSPPNPIYILTPKDGNSISSKISYVTFKGKIEGNEPIELGENTLGNYAWKTDNEEED